MLVALFSEMLSSLFRASARVVSNSRFVLRHSIVPANISSCRYGSDSPYQHHPEQDPEFDDRWEQYFNKQDLDDWELRTGLNKLFRYDCVPEPRICIAALKAARRLNDLAMAVRIIEIIHYKAAKKDRIYSYVIQEIKPVLEELGIPEPHELGLIGEEQIYGPGKWGYLT